MPSEIRLFPVSKSAGRIKAVADAIDLDDTDAIDVAWRRACIDLGRELLDQGVPDRRVEIELLLLLDAAKSVIAQRRAIGIPPMRLKAPAPRRPAAPRLVAPRAVQLDLFEMKPDVPKFQAPISAELADVG